MHATFELSRLTTSEASEVLARGAIALLPTGATEAHGPHLALETDVILARHAALRAAAMLAGEGIPALVLPPLAYGVTEFAADFGGTLSLPIETATLLVRDVLIAAQRTGFRGVVVCNAHLEPGQLEALRRGVTEAGERGVRAAFPDITRKPHALRLGDEFKSGACHAGRYETSLVLAADPEAVRSHIAPSLAAHDVSLSDAIRSGKRSFREAGGEHAYFGRPSEATASEGEALYGELGAIFADAARGLLRAT